MTWQNRVDISDIEELQLGVLSWAFPVHQHSTFTQGQSDTSVQADRCCRSAGRLWSRALLLPHRVSDPETSPSTTVVKVRHSRAKCVWVGSCLCLHQVCVTWYSSHKTGVITNKTITYVYICMYACNKGLHFQFIILYRGLHFQFIILNPEFFFFLC